MPKTPKPLSQRQQQIRDLRIAQPEISATEIADLLDMSVGTIYAHLKKLRDMGALNKRQTTRPQPERTVVPDESPALTPFPQASVEEHLDGALSEIVERLEHVTVAKAELDREESELLARRERYEAAQQALKGSLPPPPVPGERNQYAESVAA